MESRRILRDQPPVIGIEIAFEQPSHLLDRLPNFTEGLGRRLQKCLHQIEILDCSQGNRFLDVQPAVPAMPRWIDTDLPQQTLERAVMAVLQALEVRSEERRVGKECRSRWSPYH